MGRTRKASREDRHEHAARNMAAIEKEIGKISRPIKRGWRGPRRVEII
jgi:hypothetical protein